MTRKLLVVVLVFLLYGIFFGQVISGNLAQLANQEVKLEGFNGLTTYPISNTKLDDQGNFNISYSKSDRGIGYLIAADNKPLFVILSGENFEIKGETLSDTESIKILKGQENKWFEQYTAEHRKREQALSAWIYLEKMYATDILFAKQQSLHQSIQKERQRIQDEDTSYLASLPKNSYVSWFLPIRKLVSSVSLVAQYRPEEIPSTLAAFRKLDYADARLYKSGLFKDAIDNHFWLLENSGKPLYGIVVEMKTSIDVLYKNASNDNAKLNEVTTYLFDLLERQSLFQASEYLALKVLNGSAFTVDKNLAQKLEMYHTMKNGNTAPDILFKGDILAPGYEPKNSPKKLSDIKSKYTVVVFGAGWCPKCTEELPEIAEFYSKWKQKSIEVVFVSLDENKLQYEGFAK
ncbi:TlpA family protein disulfide reductase [Kaistella flava (ex Peng et al. 2021)]|uniref:TlpA family protein disulfide reductase n=1 Tax=Kaistella flava (ex Peng et al. 2021) TaxID=2038776 RepID=A0A7M2Y9D4_9FLAO|nr:TlpA disulfide reductase family protein [Kaistella flava (ex Peng et al. 2021)]QOW10696.1 TlpA family protein disulfide reductase [Kaistella flava (ex Peng et al. 2021)]